MNLYADQSIQVQAIMESVGAKKDAPVLRTLLDEALAARRRKSVNKDGRLITADYALQSLEHNRCYHTPRLLFLSFGFRRTAITYTDVLITALHSLRLVSHAPTLKSHNDLIAAYFYDCGETDRHARPPVYRPCFSFVIYSGNPSHVKSSIQFESGTSDFKVDFN